MWECPECGYEFTMNFILNQRHKDDYGYYWSCLTEGCMFVIDENTQIDEARKLFYIWMEFRKDLDQLKKDSKFYNKYHKLDDYILGEVI